MQTVTRLAGILCSLILTGSAMAAGTQDHPGLSARPTAPVRQSLGGDTRYNGEYDLTYNQLRGNLEVCTGLLTWNICVPVAIDAPLTDGQATEESLQFVLDAIDAAIEAALGTVPPVVLDSINSAVQDYLFPGLVDALNQSMAQLPATMDLTQNVIDPSYFSASFTTGTGASLYGIGQLELETGVFKLIPDYVHGQIDPNRGYQGNGEADFPVRIEESTEVPAPWGTAVVTLTAQGTMGASYSLAR